MKQETIKKLSKMSICLFIAVVSFSASVYAQCIYKRENIFGEKASTQLLPSETFLLAFTFSVPPSEVTLGEQNLLFVPGGGPPTEENGGGIATGEAPVGNCLWGMICATLVYALYSSRRTGKIMKSFRNKSTNK